MNRLYCAIFLLLASAAAQVEPRFHDAVFRIPNGWRTREQNGLLLLTPADLQRSPEIGVFILPGADVRVNLPADFDQFIAKSLAAETVLSVQPLEETQAVDYDIRSRLVFIRKGPNDRAVRWFVGFNPGARFEMVVVSASSESVFHRYDGDLKVLFGSLRYLPASAAPERGSGPSDSAATPETPHQLPPGALEGFYVGFDPGLRRLLFNADGWVVKDIPQEGMIGFDFTAYRNDRKWVSP
jgi:hypothetical protein